MATPSKDLIKQLDNSMPAAYDAKLGTTLETIATKINLLLEKLDADVGVTGTDYLATLRITPLSEQ